jgi:DHA1 family bicyclomycin/chloramphenicol resistance-like MFS transporter
MAEPAAAAPGTSLSFLLLLAGLTALAPFSLQIFLPALPMIQADFAVSPAVAQLALSLSLLANACATLTYGPLSDRFGRRPVLLAGLGAFVAGSALCALAPTIGTLIAARVLQAVGAAAGMVLARAIVRDTHDRERSASVIAYLTTAMVVAPMLAPTIGALLIDLVSWRATFVLVTLVGVAVTWRTGTRLMETRAGSRGGGWSGIWRGAGSLLRNPAFAAYALQSTFAIAVFFSFIAGAPYFMIDMLGRSATEYGLYFILVSGGFMAGNLLAARITLRVGIDRMILAGTALATSRRADTLIGATRIPSQATIGLSKLLVGQSQSCPWWPSAVDRFGPTLMRSTGPGLLIKNPWVNNSLCSFSCY